MKRICLYILAVLLLGVGIWLVLYVNRFHMPLLRPHAADLPATGVSGVDFPAASSGVISASGGSGDAAPPGSEDSALMPADLDSVLENSWSVPLDTIPASITVLVNRSYLLPSTYIPADLTEPNIRFSFNYQNDKRKLRRPAADALEKMFQAAKQQNIILYGVSGYRSYARQKQIYDRNVAARGESATNTVSARPGSSEHQTGLTIDISARSVGCQLSQVFGHTAEGQWVARNAHKYGYIVRYPDGKSQITGYHYEPWHIRYVGIATATYLYKNELTLEEYYNVNSNQSGTDTGVDVEEPDEVRMATPRPDKTQ